ncbi:hypothetical protein FOZ62_001104 [Perkinsus olseni]|uniref:Uncharacterized protein n=1 Tax=Perkinsus olseni TaxID=32597 RepID=A0A7J6NQV4_PEROL|nr:hypothetical protein FOZ62_001104 [Perkinsus olseni]
MGCCGSDLAREDDAGMLTRHDSDWSVPSVVHLELTMQPSKAYSVASPSPRGNASVRSIVSQVNARKWSEEMFEEKLANRRRDRAQSIQSNRGDQTNRSTRSYRTTAGAYHRSSAGGETNRSGTSVVGNRQHISRISSSSQVQYTGDITTRSSARSISSRKRDSSDTYYWGEGDVDDTIIGRRRPAYYPSVGKKFCATIPRST